MGNYKVDKEYCMSSFLMYRTICDDNKSFCKMLTPRLFKMDSLVRTPVYTSEDLGELLRKQIVDATNDGKAALALSGGIDSAILARFMPAGAVVYTFRCVIPGKSIVDESARASEIARVCGLEHRIIDITWDNFDQDIDVIMAHKGAPCHSIEIQIYEGAKRARKDGFKKLIFGESADLNYGGLDGLLSREWSVGEFVSRYAYVKPWDVLKAPEVINTPFFRHVENGVVNVHEFCRNEFMREALGSYQNACDVAGIELVVPYANTFMGTPLDLQRVRNGESKYWIRELFCKYFPDIKINPKTPMPRPMNEWFATWEGPKRKEFWENSVSFLNGDQRWLIYALERFLNYMEDKGL